MNIIGLSPTPRDVSWLAANTKVVQKLTQNLKITLSAIRLLWEADNVSRANHTCIICSTYVLSMLN